MGHNLNRLKFHPGNIGLIYRLNIFLNQRKNMILLGSFTFHIPILTQSFQINENHPFVMLPQFDIYLFFLPDLWLKINR